MLRASGGILTIILAGCSGENVVGGLSTTTDNEREHRVRMTTTTRKTTSTTINKSDSTQYEIGTSHTHEHWKLVPTNFKLTRRFRTDDGESHNMPDDKKLGVVEVKVRNQTSEKQIWVGMPFAIIFARRIYENQQGFEHPNFDYPVTMDKLERVEHMRQFAPQAYPVSPNEIVTLWGLSIVPAETVREQVTIGFDGTPNKGAEYPVRWALVE